MLPALQNCKAWFSQRPKHKDRHNDSEEAHNTCTNTNRRIFSVLRLSRVICLREMRTCCCQHKHKWFTVSRRYGTENKATVNFAHGYGLGRVSINLKQQRGGVVTYPGCERFFSRWGQQNWAAKLREKHYSLWRSSPLASEKIWHPG